MVLVYRSSCFHKTCLIRVNRRPVTPCFWPRLVAHQNCSSVRLQTALFSRTFSRKWNAQNPVFRSCCLYRSWVFGRLLRAVVSSPLRSCWFVWTCRISEGGAPTCSCHWEGGALGQYYLYVVGSFVWTSLILVVGWIVDVVGCPWPFFCLWRLV
jgi:hypothetical protein